MIKTALIGHPVSQSKSPLIHTHWMTQHEIDGQYGAIDLAPGAVQAGIRGLVGQGYRGFNVTVPHKIEVMGLCDTLDDTARVIGAVNTVVIENGRLHGINTDAYGFVQNIKAALPGYDFGAPAMILGAGGAARAAAYGLLRAGAPALYLSNRTLEKAQALQSMAPERIKIVEWDDAHFITDCQLLVNTTSLGMTGQPPLAFDLGRLPKNAAVYDIVYAPLMTDLLQAAQERGSPIVTGIGMLLYQAQAAFKAWHGVTPTVDEALMRAVMP